MPKPALETKVDDFLSRQRIAVAGVSSDASRHPVANAIYHRLAATGHDVFPVNPRIVTFEGSRCYPNIQSIPDGVDAVMIVTRPETTEQIVRDSRDAGVNCIWMHQSMDRKSSSVSSKAVAYCVEHGISVIAGACPMMYGAGADFGHVCMRWMLKVSGRLPE